MWKKFIYISIVLLLAGLHLNCDNFLSGGILDNDPNRTTEVPLLEQLANLQPVLYGFYEGDIGIFALLWMQQLAGTNHQYMAYEIYDMTTDLFDGPWGSVYMEGGLIDQNEVAERAEEANLHTVAAIAKMHEALMMATAAFVWGDMPYSQAAQPGKYPNPEYDDQLDIHNAVLALIDEAIADFNTGQTYFDGSYDFAFGGDKDKWIRAAHTLKARILLNWAEVNNGNYALALAEAQQGISSVDGNWRAYHSETAGEWNVFYQLKYQQRWYERVGAQIINMFKNDNDPRLQVFFDTTSTGEYQGSANGEFLEDASWFNDATIGGAGWHVDMVSWEENQFIIAECQYQAGNEAGALATLNATMEGIENRWADYLAGASLPRYSGLSGDALLEAIMNEKYKALVQNLQVWDDWKRTGFPVLTTYENRPVPHRFLYPEDEKNANTNFPGLLGLYHRNDNDPN
jgi:hypothetical protein